jgi:hypothetical protein
MELGRQRNTGEGPSKGCRDGKHRTGGYSGLVNTENSGKNSNIVFTSSGRVGWDGVGWGGVGWGGVGWGGVGSGCQ